MHYTEGWVLFVVAFGILGALTLLLSDLEGRMSRWLEARSAARRAEAV